MIKLPFRNTYARMPEEFFSKTDPTPVKNPSLFKFNQELAEELGIAEIIDDNDVVEYFSGNKILEGSEPIAMAYSGHQFSNFSPQLGDGRAILLGEVKNNDGVRCDIQLKGSGRTPWSRGGDGRSALGPVIREYILSEAMHKLGVPTTRALAAVTTGEQVAREGLTPGGILTRVAKGFVRVGTFQYFASQGKVDDLKKLTAYVIGRHYPEAKSSQSEHVKIPSAALLKAVVNAQAQLIAKWMSLGFIHGVMNTDNMSVAGETIDYGPCAFMDEFSHDRVYSSIDQESRYAYQNQPQIGQWNLVRFAETLLPNICYEYVTPEQGKPEEVVVMIAQQALNEYEGLYKQYWLNEMRQKLGMATTAYALSTEQVFEQSMAEDSMRPTENIKSQTNIVDEAKVHEQNANDHALITRLLDIMQAGKADFTLTFYHLSQDIKQLDKVRDLFESVDDFDIWAKKWQGRLRKEASTTAEQQALMQSVNPVYIPRNHQVEAAIRAAEDHNDFTKFDELHKVLQTPFELQDGMDDYMLPPKPEEIVHQTFAALNVTARTYKIIRGIVMLKWDDVLSYAKNGNLAPKQRVEKTEEEWKSLLTDESFRVTRQHGTEMPHSSDMCSLFEDGIYACVCCGTLLFDATEKFESGTGWPSFTQPLEDNVLNHIGDTTHGMTRIETTCSTCDAHLGHVFPDGPKPSGLRFCMNAVSLSKVSD